MSRLRSLALAHGAAPANGAFKDLTIPAQHQTTHAWPPARHWQAWFATDTPPDD
jgi:hypothetical protein